MSVVEKVYTYETVNKKGETVTKRVVRKYTTQKDNSNSLHNKVNKELLVKNIRDNLEQIKNLPSRKQMNFIRENCLPENVTASYNSLKTILVKILGVTDVTGPGSTLGVTDVTGPTALEETPKTSSDTSDTSESN